MKVKIDTKEKFHVISLAEPNLSANMTEELRSLLVPYIQQDIKNLIVKMTDVAEIDKLVAESLADIQQVFYENNCSCVICELQPQVEKMLDDLELLEVLNITRTESEAWDIVQMEEIERELL